MLDVDAVFSAAIRRGLIEARLLNVCRFECARFPRRFAAASLKRRYGQALAPSIGVFRGDSPRPH